MNRIAELLKLLKQTPDDPNLHYAIAEEYLRIGKADDAVVHCGKAIEARSHDPAIFVLLFQAELLRGNTSALIPLLTSCAEKQILNYDLKMIIADTLLTLDKHEESVAWYLHIVGEKQNCPQAFARFPIALAKSGRSDYGLDVLQRMLQLHPESALFHAVAARFFSETGQFDQTQHHVSTAQKLRPDDLDATTECALALETAGKLSAAFDTNLMGVDLADKHITSSYRDYWFIRNYAELLAQRRRLIAKLGGFSSNHADSERSKRLVVFVSENVAVKARELKLASGLRKLGWTVVFLTPARPSASQAEFFDHVVRYRGESELLEIAKGFKKSLFHVFVQWGGNLSTLLCLHKPGKIVFDPVDIVETVFERNLYAPGLDDQARAIPHQMFALSRADGICTKDLMLLPARKDFGYKLARPVLMFPDYCWNKPSAKGTLRKPDGSIHVVYAGSLAPSDDPDSSYVRTAKHLTDAGIHFHIFPHPWWLTQPRSDFEHFMREYLDLAAKIPFFHFHEPVQPNELFEQLQQYDFGINIHAGMTFGVTRPKVNLRYCRYCGSAKLYDYLDAGLPMILNRETRFQFAAFARYGIAIDAKEVLLGHNAQGKMRALLEKAREQNAFTRARNFYSIEHQIPRLARFYTAILDLKKA